MRFASPISALALLVACGACSTAPPPLPTDTTGLNRSASLTVADFPPGDAAMSCEAIGSESAALRLRMKEANDAVLANRRSNQTALFLAGALALPMVETNSAEKDFMVQAQQRLDVLGKLAVVKQCKPAA